MERCIYGVDIDPVAVELAKLALWIETMDPRLPFGFLDHKLKVGNSLVGCWLDEFQDYPLTAWEREDGDVNHTNFVHHYRETVGSRGKSHGNPQRKGDKWTNLIKNRKAVVKDELAQLLVAATQTAFSFGPQGTSAAALHADIRSALEAMHAAPIHDVSARATIFAEQIRDSPALRELRHVLDGWCAIWFWPGATLDDAPTPRTYAAPSEATSSEVARLAASWRFFHWEIEFPDVFGTKDAGFDALVGNPPWNILKPNSMEFFSNIDPLYRTYTKQEGLARQKELFEEEHAVEDDWIAHRGRFKALSNWAKHRSSPFGEPSTANDGMALSRSKEKSASLHAVWKRSREARHGYSDPRHPYRHQGSGDLNTYKLFLEMALRLLARGGRMGFLTPSGIYSDLGTQELRQLFLSQADWSHLYAFQNERFIFPGVDHRFKIVALNVTKADRTAHIRTEFRLGPGGSPTADEAERDLTSDESYIRVPAASVTRFSPRSSALLELKNEREFGMLDRIVEAGVPLGEAGSGGWMFRYTTEFHMTNDSSSFVRRPKLEEAGYRQCVYGHWLRGEWRDGDGGGGIASADGRASIGTSSFDDVAVPLYQGVMVQQFDPSAKSWVRGTGLKAQWDPVSWERKTFGPQFLVRAEDYARSEKVVRGAKLGFRDIARSTDERTFISSVLPDFGCGNVIGVLGSELSNAWLVAGLLNSFVVDWCVRRRVTGTHLNYFIVEELPLLRPVVARRLERYVAGLSLGHLVFARLWTTLRRSDWVGDLPWRALWAMTPHERKRQRAILDATVAKLYGLERDDVRHVLDGCDHPSAFLNHAESSRSLDPVGFWRAERDEPPELRHSVLSLLAFDALERLGLEGFLSMNDGKGWMLPETVRLADHGLGHDQRALDPQPVASVLGPRFYDWQLRESADASWAECERHAEMIERIMPLPKPAISETSKVEKPQAGRTDLFGNVLETDFSAQRVEKPGKRGRR